MLFLVKNEVKFSADGGVMVESGLGEFENAHVMSVVFEVQGTSATCRLQSLNIGTSLHQRRISR